MHIPESQRTFLDKVKEVLQKYDALLKDINHKIWSNPELAYEEYQAHDRICELFDGLQESGYRVHRKAFGLDTALEVDYVYGTGGRVIAFNAEYDALPGIGHACGHNLIATSSIAAFIATCESMKAKAESLSVTGFTVRLLGTPAEESGGGKVKLIKAGAYKDVDACLMVHPIPMIPGKPDIHCMATSVEGGFLANDKVKVTFTGKPAHAAAAPWEGINALDAVVSAYVNISMLRQQILPSQKVHGVIVNGAIDQMGPSYADLKTNLPICESYVSAMRAMGHHTLLDNSEQKGGLSGGSTDMGNVSYEVPGFHGMFCIPAEGVNHTPQFTNGAGSPEGFERSIACAAGMAVVACQILVDDKFAEEVQRNFKSC
ncbi:hypothetical protein N7450_000417 [Penicillium hetheringtonii]|uniref:Peptidase M20 domain-containing protein 2 n=1 Tax=Penicillium hetheringtonii TaxID=911720 RepID=A0AAD6E3C5_9EURO|nr:hypothetical protein N7450_000417 [Penicillium hetheringtonii]